MSDDVFSLALRMGDNALILAQQNAAWCGHAPTVEEDIAMSNIALDLLGQARLWLDYAGQVEGQNQNADDLAYFRDSGAFKNAYLVEQPSQDYAYTLTRQYLFDHWHHHRLEDLSKSQNNSIREIAQKSLNEVRYHLRRSHDLVVRLANGNEESHRRIQDAVTNLWSSFLSLFEDHELDPKLEQNNIATCPSHFKMDIIKNIRCEIGDVITLPDSDYYHKGAVNGVHSEHLGHILAKMQILQRSYPGLEW